MKSIVTRISPWMVLAGSLSTAIGTLQATDPPLTAIAFSPDGQAVVVGSQAGLAVKSWPSLETRKSIPTTLVNVHDLAFSPDGTRLAAAGGEPAESGFVEVFAWPDFTFLFRCGDHDDNVLNVAWKDDTCFATASLDHDVVLWDANSQEPLLRLSGHSRGVSSLCFLNEQQLLVSGGLDQNLRVWNIETGEMLRTLNNHTREVNQIVIRPTTDNAVAGSTSPPMLASISEDSTVRLWQPTIGRMVRFARLSTVPRAVAWLPDGSQLVVAGTDGHIQFIDPETAQIIQDIPALDGWAYSLAVHPFDGSLVAGGRDGVLKRIVPGPT